MAGVLEGVTIVEFEGLGPGPFCGMMLADHGARVIRISRKGAFDLGARDVLSRNRERMEADLKNADDVVRVREVIKQADGLIEGFRPGVMERLGLGPDVLLADNPRLIYGRMTGWGQTGTLAHAAGHDMNYISISGNLHGYGRAGEKPTPPINAIGDFAGGGMMLAFGIVAGILNARATGKGQVVDCAMTDGAAVIHAMTWGFRGLGFWRDERGVNKLDTGAPYYDVYETKDEQHISIGSIEKQFYALLLKTTGLDANPLFAEQDDEARWPEQKKALADLFLTKTRDEWDAVMLGTDICYAPILSMKDALVHPHNVARGTFTTVDGTDQPRPAPRFMGTPAAEPVGRRQTQS